MEVTLLNSYIDYLYDNTNFNLSYECPNNLIFHNILMKILTYVTKEFNIKWPLQDIHGSLVHTIYSHNGTYVTDVILHDSTQKTYTFVKKLQLYVNKKHNKLIRSLLDEREYADTALVNVLFNNLSNRSRMIVYESIIDDLKLTDEEHLLWASMINEHEQ